MDPQHTNDPSPQPTQPAHPPTGQPTHGGPTHPPLSPTTAPQRAPQTSLTNDPAMRMILPVGRSGWAIAAGYLGLISVTCVPGPIAVIVGILAIRDIQQNPDKRGMGRAAFGIIMGMIGTVALLVAIINLSTNQ